MKFWKQRYGGFAERSRTSPEVGACMSGAKISIAMATFNGERYLQAQLASLARQSLRPHEIVISDDGSSDRTLQIVDDFARSAPFPVHVHRNERQLGFADNFLRAALRCSGEIIAFCDQDDVWLENKLARCAPAFEDQSVLLVMHSGCVVDKDLRPTGGLFPRVTADRVVGPLQVDPWGEASGFAMLFRACLPLVFSVAERPWSSITRDAPMVHDGWVWFLAGIFGKIAFVREPLVLYRRHGSTVTTPEPKTAFEMVRQSVSAGAAQYAAQAELAAQRAELIERTAPLLPEDFRVYSRRGALHYRAIHEILVMRSSLYAPKGHLAWRIRKFASLLAAKAYRPRERGGLGLRSFLKDLTVGLFGTRILSEYQ